MLWVAPCIAVTTALAGFVVSNAVDWPPAQTIVGLQTALLPVAWLRRALRQEG